MAMLFNATAVQSAAYASILSQKVTAILTVVFSHLDFFKAILVTATKVLTSFGGGGEDTPA